MLEELHDGHLGLVKMKALVRSYVSPHSTTGVSPAQLLLGRPLRTRLDLVKPNLNRKMVNQQHQQSFRAANEKGRHSDVS